MRRHESVVDVPDGDGASAASLHGPGIKAAVVPPARSGPASTTRRLVEAARDAAAVDAATAAAAAADGGRGATNHLERLLLTVPPLEQAKGVLMGYYGIDADAAFQVLRRWSQNSNQRVVEICDQLLRATARPADQPFSGLHAFLSSHPTLVASTDEDDR